MHGFDLTRHCTGYSHPSTAQRSEASVKRQKLFLDLLFSVINILMSVLALVSGKTAYRGNERGWLPWMVAYDIVLCT